VDVNEIKKYKVVRRGPKWCVRVKGRLNTTDSFGWCRDRKMSYHIKQHWNTRWGYWYLNEIRDWDYDFIFDKPTEATAFVLGYL
jgi:hypothetical protein